MHVHHKDTLTNPMSPHHIAEGSHIDWNDGRQPLKLTQILQREKWSTIHYSGTL